MARPPMRWQCWGMIRRGFWLTRSSGRGSLIRNRFAMSLAATKDFPGASGSITIDANRNALKPIVVLELRGGKTHKVDAIAPK